MRDVKLYSGEEEIKIVNSFKYLRSEIDYNEEIDEDVASKTHIDWMKCREASSTLCCAKDSTGH